MRQERSDCDSHYESYQTKFARARDGSLYGWPQPVVMMRAGARQPHIGRCEFLCKLWYCTKKSYLPHSPKTKTFLHRLPCLEVCAQPIKPRRNEAEQRQKHTHARTHTHKKGANTHSHKKEGGAKRVASPFHHRERRGLAQAPGTRVLRATQDTYGTIESPPKIRSQRSSSVRGRLSNRHRAIMPVEKSLATKEGVPSGSSALER